MTDKAKQPVRILFVNDHLGYPGGVVHGGGMYLVTLLPQFDRCLVEPAVAILRSYHPTAELLKTERIQVTFFERRKWDPRALSDIVSLGHRFRADLLHLNGMKAHFLGRIAALILKVPAVIHLHYQYRPFPSYLNAALARHTAMALSISQILYNHAIKAFHMPIEKVGLLYNPIDVNRFSDPDQSTRDQLRSELGINADSPVIGLIGRVITKPDKGHRTLIRAWPEVLLKFPHAILVIVGDGSAMPECKRLAKNIGVSENIRFVGQRDDIPDVLAMVDIAVAPSENEEAFGYVVLEAMCAGRPVIGSRIGGIIEALDDGRRGMLVTPGDSSGFARAICQLLNNPPLAERFVISAKEYATQFSVAQHMNELIDIYKTILD